VELAYSGRTCVIQGHAGARVRDFRLPSLPRAVRCCCSPLSLPIGGAGELDAAYIMAHGWTSMAAGPLARCQPATLFP
jgi:hypothetical protein